MVDQNAWTPSHAGLPYPPRLPLPPRLPSVVPGILLMVAGVLGMLLALGIIMIPGVLFLLGGGGNVDAFDDFASGFILTSHILGFASLAALILGIVLTVITARKRRRIRSAAMGWRRPR
ncbi:hypothetical protein [Brevibacterium zhoupengii]|uniref:hypothetical protein n=1 Tax=Brevibacterium zhoupengii TaxID=2898795 RepID=UPI001E4FF90B|nr:hypothetical protein [Brevibacterium zhoupengii]